MDEAITWVGIDAHKKNLQFAVLLEGAYREWEIPNEAKAIERVARKLVKQAPGEVRCCYEAGPVGYALKRALEGAAPELVCEVVAPSLIPVKAGDRIKTDRRDARKLAKYLQSGLLTEVRPPTESEESARDLTRCRRALGADLTRARHRLSKWLLRRGVHYPEGTKHWTDKHMRWLRGLRFERPVDQLILRQHLLVLDQLLEHLAYLDEEIRKLSESDAYREHVGWLRCFRGIDTSSAMTLLTEVHDFRRFDSPLQLMSYLGLTPSEHSSGETRRQGSITKAGNTHARRVLVEISWHYRHRTGAGAELRKRRHGQPAWAIALSDKAQLRLCTRYQRMVARGKPTQKAVVAIARELIGFLWAVIREGEQRALSH